MYNFVKNLKCNFKTKLLTMAKDIFHETVRKALEKDGWTITHDPYYLNDKIKNIKYEIDLGAEKLLAAERDSEKIAVEIKSFTKISFRHEFHSVLGQYLIYYKGLYQIEVAHPGNEKSFVKVIIE